MSKNIFIGFLFGCLIVAKSFSQTFTAGGGSIPDFPAGTQCFNLNVTGLTNNLYADYGLVSATINITHPYDGDLEIVLVSPNGVQTILSSNNGGSGDNYTNTIFTMSAATPIALGAAPFTGSFIPEQSFYSQNAGQDGNGVWQLCITDEVSTGTGILVDWSLTFGPGATGITDPGPNPVATDGCAGAPLICNLNGYSGSTSSSYTWTPANEPSGTAQTVPGPAGTFCGTHINNSSWIRFQASASSVSLNIDVTNCTGTVSPLGEFGIQLALYNGCGAPWTYSPSSLPVDNSAGPAPNDENVPSCYGDGIHGLGNTLSFDNLVIGNIYYIMFDGWAGNQCDYVINVNNGVQVVNITPSANPICEGDTIDLVASAPGTLNTYTWSSVPSSSLPSGANIQVHPTVSTVYTVVASGICGSQSASIPITVIPSGNPAWTAPPDMCANVNPVDLTTYITGTSGGSWTGTGVVGSDFNPAGLTGTYPITYTTGTAPCQKNEIHNITVLPTPNPTITIVGDTDICTYQTVLLSAGSPVGGNYLWNNGSTATGISVNSSGTYWVTVTNANGCIDGDTVNISLINHPSPNPTIAPSTPVICNNQPITLSTQTGFISYNWSNGSVTDTAMANMAGLYSVIVTDTNSCVDTAFINVIASNLDVIITGDNVLCPGEVTTLIANGGTSYLWSTSATTTSINTGIPGTYIVSSTNAQGCSNSDTIQVLMSAFNPSLNGDTIVCPGENIDLTAGGGNAYIWNTGATTANVQPPLIATTTYSVSISNVDGCSDTLFTTVHLYTDYNSAPDLMNDSAQSTFNNPVVIPVTNNDVVVNTITVWDNPSNGTASVSGGDITYTPNTGFSGYDTLTYISCDANCLSLCDTATVIIYVNSGVLNFPEFISPNGDFSNDDWYLGDLSAYPENELTIMNRWGDPLYHAKPYNNDWHGQTNMGIPAMTQGVTDGTYFFVFIASPGAEPVKGFIEVRK